ncbi:MAG: hypothetical protein WA364_19295, partial [Candidatus Nitrosopolaris sp.]
QSQNTGSKSSTSTNNTDPAKVSTNIKNTFTNTKNLSVNHAFVSSRIIGPDRFRYVTSYWTTSDVSRLIDAGRSAGNISSGSGVALGLANANLGPVNIPRATLSAPGQGFIGGFGLPPTIPLSNLQTEVDRGEGYSTLAIVLQYEGVVSLAGITAGLKLPTGFEAQYPLTNDRHNSDIALANYDGGIRPSQEIVLYFPMYVLPNAPVQIPVLGPLALHFLRSAPRSVGDSLITTDANMFAKVLTITNGTNQTVFNNSLGLNKNYSDKSARLIPWDFVNQVIPVIFKATGREVLDVYQDYHKCGKSCWESPIITPPTNQTTTPTTNVDITFANHGDVPLFNLVVQFNTVVQAVTGSGSTFCIETGSCSTLFSPQLPIVIQGPSTFYFTGLGPGQNRTIQLAMSTQLDCNTNQLLQADSSYNNVIGVRADQIQNIGLTTAANSPYCTTPPPKSGGTPTNGSPGGTPTTGGPGGAGQHHAELHHALHPETRRAPTIRFKTQPAF